MRGGMHSFWRSRSWAPIHRTSNYSINDGGEYNLYGRESLYSPPASSRAGRDTAGISEGDGWNGCRGRDNVTMTVVVTGRVTELPGTNQAMSEPVGRRFHCNWKEARRPFIDSFCFPSPPPSNRVPFVAELHSHLFTYSVTHSLALFIVTCCVSIYLLLSVCLHVRLYGSLPLSSSLSLPFPFSLFLYLSPYFFP